MALFESAHLTLQRNTTRIGERGSSTFVSHASSVRKHLELGAPANRVEPAMAAKRLVRQVSGLDRLTHQLQATLVVAATLPCVVAAGSVIAARRAPTSPSSIVAIPATKRAIGTMLTALSCSA